MKFAIRRPDTRRPSSSGKDMTMKRTIKYPGQIPRAEHTPAFKVLARIEGGILADMGSVMELLPMYRLSLRDVRPFDNDKAALSSDWHRIGNDMWRALNNMTRASNERKAD
ncbi:MAG: hypothetical protein U1F76_27120 [Candidatus Competibacteraceae bacterium]